MTVVIEDKDENVTKSRVVVWGVIGIEWRAALGWMRLPLGIHPKS